MQQPANGAGFSWLHEATGAHLEFDGYDFWANGAKNKIGTNNGFNTLICDYNPSNQSISNLGGTLNIAPIGNGPFDGPGQELILSGGNFNFSGLTEGDLAGAIDYTVTNTALSGTFYFYHYNFTGGSLSTGPNNLSVSGSDLDVQLWGNDQMKSMGSNVAPSMLRGDRPQVCCASS